MNKSQDNNKTLANELTHATRINPWIPATPRYGYAVCCSVPKCNTVPVPALPVWEEPRVYPYPCGTLQMSSGFYTVDNVIRSLDQYSVTRQHVSAYLEDNTKYLSLSCSQIEFIDARLYNLVFGCMVSCMGPLGINTRSLESTYLPIGDPIPAFWIYPVGGKVLYRHLAFHY
jgi:hypothetical protein